MFGVSFVSLKVLHNFNFHRLFDTFFKQDFVFLKKNENIFFVKPKLNKGVLEIFFLFLQFANNLNNSEKLLSFFSFSKIVKSDFFSLKLRKCESFAFVNLTVKNLALDFQLHEVKKRKILTLLFSHKTKFEFVFWFQFIKKMYFTSNIHELLTVLDPFTYQERSFLKRGSGNFFKKSFFSGKSFKDFQMNVKDRIFGFAKRHRIKKRAKLLSILFDVNIDFLRAKESRLPDGLRGIIPYKFVSKKKSSSYIFWHMENFYSRFLVKLLKLTKKKKKSLKIFSFLRKLNFFKAKKKSLKTGRYLQKNRFLLEADFDPLPNDRLHLLGSYRQRVKFFYLLKKAKNISLVKSKKILKTKINNLNKNIFNFLLWCNKLKNYQKSSFFPLINYNVLLQSGSRFFKFFFKNSIFFKLRKLGLNFSVLNKKILKKFQFIQNSWKFKRNKRLVYKKKPSILVNSFYRHFNSLFNLKKNKLKIFRLFNVANFFNSKHKIKSKFKKFSYNLNFDKKANLKKANLKKANLKKATNLKNLDVLYKKIPKDVDSFFKFKAKKWRLGFLLENHSKKFRQKYTKSKYSFSRRGSQFSSRFLFYKPVANQKFFCYGKKQRNTKNVDVEYGIFSTEQALNKNQDFLSLNKIDSTLTFFFSQLRSHFEYLVEGYPNPDISNYVSKIYYPIADSYPQNAYKKIEDKPTLLSYSDSLNRLFTNSFQFFGCFKSQQMLKQLSVLLHCFDCSFFNLKFFKFLEIGFLSLINFNNLNSILNDRFVFYLQNLISYKKAMVNSLKIFDFSRQYWENITHPEFWLNKNKRISYISPGMIIFTLNSNSVFLTVLNNAGHTVFQTSTGAVNKKKYTHENIRKVIIRGYRARREVYKRMLHRLFKRLKAIRSKKTRRAKRKQLVSVVQKKSKKKLKGNKLRKFPKGKTFYLTFHIVRKMLSLLTPLVNYMQTYVSHNHFFKLQVLRKKLQLKLDKLKMSKKFNTKAFYLILRRLKNLNLKRKRKRNPRIKSYYFVENRKGHIFVQRRISNLMSFFPNENLTKSEIKHFLLKRKRKENLKFFSYEYKNLFLHFWLKQKQNKKEKLQFVLKNLCLLPFEKKVQKFNSFLFIPKLKEQQGYFKNRDQKHGFLKKKEKRRSKDFVKRGQIVSFLYEKYTEDLFKKLSQGRVSLKTFKVVKKLGRVYRWFKLQNSIKKSFQTWERIRFLTAKRLTRYLLLFKSIDDNMIRRAFKFLLTKFFEKIGNNRLTFDQKVTKLGVSVFFYFLVKQQKQAENASGISLYF